MINNLFDSVLEALSFRWKVRHKPRTKRAFRCECDSPIFFRNSQCLNCHAQLGYEPVVGDLRALHSGTVPNSWRPIGDDIERDYRRCANFDSPVGCNWLVAAEDPVDLCMACRLNRTIPDLPKAISTKLNRRLLAASAAPPVFKKRLRFILLMD